MKASESPTNPFPGLRPFESYETHLFFGRDRQSEELLSQLKRARFIAVVGISGSGKSSLVRAGLLPALQGGLMASAGSGWRIALFRPGNDPIGNMAQALMSQEVFGSEDRKRAGMQMAIAETTLRRSSLGLIEVVRRARVSSDTNVQPGFSDRDNLLIVVDQFEELFRFKQLSDTGHPEEAAAFVKLLLETTLQREERIYVVLTMRSDYLGDCSQFWDLPEAINNGQYLIPRMTREERRAAIAGPVAVGRGRITEPLINQLLNDVGDNPDQLPILQHALMRTWTHWLKSRNGAEAIDIHHYNAIGEMSAALSIHADEAYNELSEQKKSIAEKLFKSLTEKGTDNREIRRPMRLKDIFEVIQAKEDDIKSVIETFRQEGRSFLMPSADKPLTPESLIDISHESLIRNWVRLKEWVSAESTSARIYRRLVETAMLNKEGGAELLREPELQVALNWRERNNPNKAWAQLYHSKYNEITALYDEAIAFLDESKAQREAEAAEKERLQKKQAEQDRQALENAQALAAQKEQIAEIERQRAEEQQMLAEAERQRAEEQRKRAEDRDKAARRLFWLTSALAVMFVLATGTAVYAIRLKKLAENQARIISESLEKEKIASGIIAESLEKAQVATQKALDAKAEAQEARRKADERAIEAENQKTIAIASQERALAERNRAEAERNRAEGLKNLGELYRDASTLSTSGKTDEAVEKFKQVLSTYEKDKDPVRTLSTLLTLAEMQGARSHQQEGAYEQAIQYYKNALPLMEAGGEQDKQAETLIKMGKLRELGEAAVKSQTANAYFDRAVRVYQQSHKKDKELDTLVKIGDNYFDSDSPDAAAPYYERAFPLMEAAGLREQEVGTLMKLGDFYQDQESSDLDEPQKADGTQKADEYYNRAVQVYQKSGEKEKELDTLTKIGDVFFDLSGKERLKAIGYYNQAVVLLHRTGDEAKKVAILVKIGDIYYATDDAQEKQKAAKFYNSAVEIYRKLDDKPKQVTTLIKAASLYNTQDEAKADEYYNQAAAVYDPSADRANDVSTLIRIGRLYDGLKKPQKADEYYKRALQLYHDAGDRAGEASALIDIGKGYFTSKDNQKADLYYDRALKVYRDSGDRAGEALVYSKIAEAYFARDRVKALEYYNQARTGFQTVGDRAGEARALSGIASIQSFLKDEPKALDYYNHALALFRDAGDRAAEGTTLNTMALIYHRSKDEQKALDYYKQAASAFEQVLPALKTGTDHRKEATTLYSLGAIYSSLGDRQKALDYLNQALPLYQKLGDRSRENLIRSRIRALSKPGAKQ